jgi:hypothetical protein
MLPRPKAGPLRPWLPTAKLSLIQKGWIGGVGVGGGGCPETRRECQEMGSGWGKGGTEGLGGGGLARKGRWMEMVGSSIPDYGTVHR